jgi:flagellar hook-associated protein 1 FlgK
VGVSAVLDIAKTSLAAQQLALATTGHNIANADTKGYCRQTAVLGSRPSVSLGNVIMGSGVQVDQITRAYDSFATKYLNQQTGALSSVKAQSDYMSVLESALNDVGDNGLTTSLNDFWGGWQDLANNPSGSAERGALIQKGEQLASQLNNSKNQIDSVGAEIKQQVVQGVSDVNQMFSQVAQLNGEITSMETGQGEANDLRDKRDLLLNKLSEAIGAKYFEGPNGQVSVFVANRMMVAGVTSHSFTTQAVGDSVAVQWQGSQSNSEDVSNQIAGGTVGGYLSLLTQTLPDLAGKLDDFASSLIFEVNSLHSQGVGAQAPTSATGDQQATDAGVAMSSAASGLAFGQRIDDSGSAGFKVWAYDASGAPLVAGGTQVTITAGMSLNDLAAALDAVGGISASVVNGRLQVAADAAEGGASFAFSNDTSHALAALGVGAFFSGHDAGSIGVQAGADDIAAGQINAAGSFASGDGRNALAIADIQDTAVNVGSANMTLNDALGSLTGAIGVKSAALSRDYDFKKGMLDQLQAQRDSQSGVSLDEELTNMIKYQQAYQAAARLLQTADAMLSSLITPSSSGV